ncbi:MAG: Flp pilus assembly complex ATPase component TadA [Phycisphaeraceae bacterium]|nr:MAG: Flp pilus assembly complex ATPase component TadA [Phycisphaeraceae bacterium]
MAKYNVDDILKGLGMGDESAPDKSPARKHRVDRAESSFSPLPAVPANQVFTPVDTQGHPARASQDPAVPAPPRPAPPSAVGAALSDVYQPDASGDQGATSDLPGFLLERGVVAADKITTAQQILRQSPGRRLTDVLVEQGVDENTLQPAVAAWHNIPFEKVDLEKGLDGGFDGMLLQRLTVEFCKQHLVVPLRHDGSRVVIGATRPDDAFVLDEIRARLGVPCKLVLVTSFDVRAALEIVTGKDESAAAEDVNQILADVEEGDVQVEKGTQEAVDLQAEAAGSPVIKIVNHIIQMASKEGASDIHIEPAEKKLKVRFRIDGELYEMLNPPAGMAPAITSRLKIMANLDISERRLPQDGRIRCQVGGRKLDLRMSTLPTPAGEKTVMRILDTRSINVELDQLGFDENTLQIWKKQVESPHGIVLVTGPTGSGKTTTLYASIRQLDKNSMNISTVEDPVEYHLDGITQTQTHEKIGMTFAVALRSLLRQDPDVIMLGEIRDHETAMIAVQAALTGHLVLSTLHTNDAPSSITRLVNIGLEPFLVGAAVNAVLAQRLIRRLCTHCKQTEKPSEEMAEYLAMNSFDADELWIAKGCDKCRNTGYSGRVGIYELLVVDDHLRDIVARNPNVAEFRRMCVERGMVSLRQDGMRKVAQGVTSVQEVLRVTEAAH